MAQPRAYWRLALTPQQRSGNSSATRGIGTGVYAMGWTRPLVTASMCQSGSVEQPLERRERGGPRFRKFGRRVMYAVADLDAWAEQHSFEATSDPEYAEHHSADTRTR